MLLQYILCILLQGIIYGLTISYLLLQTSLKLTTSGKPHLFKWNMIPLTSGCIFRGYIRSHICIGICCHPMPYVWKHISTSFTSLILARGPLNMLFHLPRRYLILPATSTSNSFHIPALLFLFWEDFFDLPCSTDLHGLVASLQSLTFIFIWVIISLISVSLGRL